MLDRTFAQEFLQTIDDPAKHGVHLLFNAYWRFIPEDAKAKYVDAFHADPVLHAWYEERWFPEPYSFDALGALAPNTLGYAYFRHIIDNDLNKEIATGYRGFHEHLERSGMLDNMPDEVKFSTLRGFQTHDLQHMVTGFLTTGTGEIALQAFGVGQQPNLYNAIWMIVVTTRMAFLAPESQQPIMDAITEGYMLGRRTPNLSVVKWETMLDRDLETIRREYGIPSQRMLMAA